MIKCVTIGRTDGTYMCQITKVIGLRHHCDTILGRPDIWHKSLTRQHNTVHPSQNIAFTWIMRPRHLSDKNCLPIETLVPTLSPLPQRKQSLTWHQIDRGLNNDRIQAVGILYQSGWIWDETGRLSQWRNCDSILDSTKTYLSIFLPISV